MEHRCLLLLTSSLAIAGHGKSLLVAAEEREPSLLVVAGHWRSLLAAAEERVP